MESLEHTKAAEQAKSAKRKSQNRRQVQKGGVLYASEARQMVQKRLDTEVEKAERQLRQAQNALQKDQQAKEKKDQARQKEEEAKQKLLLKQIRAYVKKRRSIQAYKKKVSKLIATGLKKQAKLRKPTKSKCLSS